MNGQQIDAVERAREAAQARIAELERWVADLQSGMYVNCVYCGHRYGPEDHVPATMADALKDHIEACPRHPMSDLKRRVVELTMILERDRTRVAVGVNGIRKATSRRHWLTEGRGSYAWDDDRWKGEFAEALVEIENALLPLAGIASDWTNCPTNPVAIAVARAMPPTMPDNEESP